jgi:hypothetical protein
MYEYARYYHSRLSKPFSITLGGEVIATLKNKSIQPNVPYAYLTEREGGDISYHDIGILLVKHHTGEQIKILAVTMLEIISNEETITHRVAIASNKKLASSLALIVGAGACEAARGYSGLMNTLATYKRIALYHKEDIYTHIKTKIFLTGTDRERETVHATGFLGSQACIISASRDITNLGGGSYNKLLKRDLDYLFYLDYGGVMKKYIKTLYYVFGLSIGLTQVLKGLRESFEKFIQEDDYKPPVSG